MAFIRKLITTHFPACAVHLRFLYYFFINLWFTAGLYRKGVTQHKRIFVAAIPKSGSTWIEQFFYNSPNVVLRPINGSRHEILKQDLPNNAFDCFPKAGICCVKTHTNPNRRNISILKREKIRSVLVVFRDPRDIIVSRYFHLLNNPKAKNEPHGEKNYAAMKKSDALMHSTHVVKEEYIPWMIGWQRESIKADLKIKIVKYEDLYDTPLTQFISISNFFSLGFSVEEVQGTVENILHNRAQDNLSQRPAAGKKSTFRSGGHGKWKAHFTEKEADKITRLFRKDLDELGYS